MTRRDPFSEIEDLFERMDRELEKIGPAFEGSRSPSVSVDVVETDDEVVVTADLPGFDADSIDVELHDDALTITATRESEHDATADADPDVEADEPQSTGAAGPRYHRHERRHGSASRRIPIPVAVEAGETTAAYDDGVLTVTLPKRSASESGGHRIDVE